MRRTVNGIWRSILEKLILTEERKVQQQQQLKKAPRHKRQYRVKENSPLKYNESSDKKIKHACGLSRDDLNIIQKHVNSAVDAHEHTYKLDREDLFIVCYAWMQNMSYSFAAVTFGYA